MDEAYRPCYGRARGAVESSRHRIYHQGRAQLRIIFSTAVLNFVCFFCKLHDASKISVETECTEPRCTSADDHVGACHGALVPASATLRKYRKGKKDTGTYGKQWTETWITGPGKKIDSKHKEGWVHPWDGRIHAKWNQLEAETGRSGAELRIIAELAHATSWITPLGVFLGNVPSSLSTRTTSRLCPLLAVRPALWSRPEPYDLSDRQSQAPARG